MKLFLRYICFIAGLFLLSIGIDLIVVSALGTTPISSVNYVLSIYTPLSLGAATFVFNIFVIIAQFWLIRGMGSRKDRIEIALQIPFSLLFSVFIDINMQWIERIPVTGYHMSLLLLGAGLIIQAVGVTLELKPNVAIMSAEGFVKYYCRRHNTNFGKTKIIFDVTLVVTAVAISLIMGRRISGVREGTLIAAISTGILVNIFARRLLTRANIHRVGKLYHYPAALLRKNHTH